MKGTAAKAPAVRAEDRAGLPWNPSAAEREEMAALGVSATAPERLPGRARGRDRKPRVPRRAIRAPGVLNEATDYLPTPSAFSRGLRVPLGGGTDLLLISGTASVDERGRTVHAGDFRAQLWRTLRNITGLLESEGADWHDVVRTTCYLRDIERDYQDFNEVRTWFFRSLELDPVPASTGIQARICRSDLLVEIEAMALVRRDGEGGRT
jgi:enamine deaminase RidA (YjgF/YER057c/UK114 family)